MIDLAHSQTCLLSPCGEYQQGGSYNGRTSPRRPGPGTLVTLAPCPCNHAVRQLQEASLTHGGVGLAVCSSTEQTTSSPPACVMTKAGRAANRFG
jgi:hypothetical protein